LFWRERVREEREEREEMEEERDLIPSIPM
jgi:hypothetical protein